MNYKTFRPLLSILCLLLVAVLLPATVLGQQNQSYKKADQLLSQQKYEEAAQLFEQLHQQSPNRYLYLDKLTESLINLKEYQKAISLTEAAIEKGNIRPQAMVRLGELYHISGSTKKALDIWDDVLSKYSGDQQVYLRVARAAKQRKEFDKSISIYQELQSQTGNSNLITSEIGETYLQAGDYEEAMQKFFELIRNNPDRLTYVQRRLMRFRDDYVYDVAVLEISDFLDNMSSNESSYQKLQQLEIWLLMERRLFERAVATAKNIEAQSSRLTYTLFNLGSKLLAEQQFKLAEQAYSYYIYDEITPLKARSREKLADVYVSWAKYLENHNLDLSSKRSSLYQQAFATLDTLREQTPNYQRIANVLTTLGELSLDVQHDTTKARQYLTELRNLSEQNRRPANEHHIEGRLYLYDGEYTRARVSLSKSNNQERIGELAQKNRYYLALTDFFAGDFEFAKIQLNALERQSTSYYANEAIQLRLWIQQGLQADSTGSTLSPFATLLEHLEKGEEQQAMETFSTLFQDDSKNPFLSYALLELNSVKSSHHADFLFQAVHTLLKNREADPPLNEQLMWVKARLADQVITNDLAWEGTQQTSIQNELFNSSSIKRPETVTQLVNIYEDLLLEFPNGFYASYARDRIQELEKKPAS